VLADEIVSGLDVSTQAQVLNLIGGLSRELGLAMAFISHDLSVIRTLCDRVYVLRLGEIVEEGPCERIFAAPRHPYTRALIDAIPLPTINPDWLRQTSPSRWRFETATRGAPQMEASDTFDRSRRAPSMASGVPERT
jgi:ABC-type oligopeptide transport system ATPase subunit